MPLKHFVSIGKAPVEITVQRFCDLLGESYTQATLDLGSTILVVAEHVQKGKLLLVSTACGRAAKLPL